MHSKVPKSLLLRACVYRSSDAKRIFVAHCLELDLIGQGRTPKDALCELIESIELQIEASEEADCQLFFAAPAGVWQRYKQAKNAGRTIMQMIVNQAQSSFASPGHTLPEFENVLATINVPQQYLSPASV